MAGDEKPKRAEDIKVDVPPEKEATAYNNMLRKQETMWTG